MQEKELFETLVIPEELDKFLVILSRVMDMGIVIELNILTDWLERQESRTKVKERLTTIESLGLNLSSKKLRTLVGD